MEIIIDEIEEYPIYIMRRGTDTRFFEKDFDIPEEQVVEWERILEEYERFQQEMRALYRSFQ